MMDAIIHEYCKKEVATALGRSQYTIIVSEMSTDDLKACVENIGWHYVYISMSDMDGNIVLGMAHEIYQMVGGLKYIENDAEKIMNAYIDHYSIMPIMANDFAHKVLRTLNDLGKFVIHLHSLGEVASSHELLGLFDSIKRNNRYPELRFVILSDFDYFNGCDSFPPFATSIIKLSKNMADNNKVFISYSWKDYSNHIVQNDIQPALASHNIPYVLDKNDCNYMDNIPQFEQTIGDGNRIIAVISCPYVKSIQCMYEMALMFQRGEVAERVLLVFIGDFDRNDDAFYQSILENWQKRREELERSVTSTPAPMNTPFVQQLGYVELILKHIGDFWIFLREENTSTLTELGANGFEKLIRLLVRDDQMISKTAHLNMDFDPIVTGTTVPTIIQYGAQSHIYNNTSNGTITINNNYGSQIEPVSLESLETIKQIVDETLKAYDNIISKPEDSQLDVMTHTINICEQFKHLVEDCQVGKMFYRDHRLPSEKDWQDLLYIIAQNYASDKSRNIHVNRESNPGCGLVDLQVTRGSEDNVIIEIKCSGNQLLKHGYEQQLQGYLGADNTRQGIFIIIEEDDQNRTQIDAVKDLYDKQLLEGNNPCKLIIINGRKQLSASQKGYVAPKKE